MHTLRSVFLVLALLATTSSVIAADEVKFRTSFESSDTILRNIINQACIDGIVYLVFQSQSTNSNLPVVSTAVTPKLQVSGKPVTCTEGQNLHK